MAVIKCPECGYQTSDKATICPSCGVEIAGKVVKCSVCGEVYFKDDILCPNCHHPHHSHEEEDTPQDIPIAPDIDSAKATATDNTSSSTLIETEDSPDYQNVNSNNQDKDNAFDATLEGERESELKASEQRKHVRDEEEDDNEIAPSSDTYVAPATPAVDHTDPVPTPRSKAIPMLVSFVITAIVGAVSIYFYRETKLSKENQAFDLAMASSDSTTLNNFLSTYSDGSDEHLSAIKARIKHLETGEIYWESVQKTPTRDSLTTYLSQYPGTAHERRALELLDSVDWAIASKANTKEAYKQYLAQHADGRHSGDAKEKVFGTAYEDVSDEERTIVTGIMNTFFSSVNSKSEEKLLSTMADSVSNFMGTAKPSKAVIAGWMKGQHGEEVKYVSWTMGDDIEVKKKKNSDGNYEYSAKFNAKQSIKKGENTSTERFKVTASIVNGKISSMSMVKVVPQESSESKPASSSSSSSSKPATSSSSKPSSSSNSKPASSSNSKPASSSSSSKPASSSSSSKSSSSSSKPSSSSSSSKSASSSSSSKSSSSSSKPTSSSSSSKPASSSSSSKSSSSSSKPSSSSSSKPASSNSSSKSSSNSSKTSSSSSSKPASSSSSSKSSSSSSKSSSSSTSKNSTNSSKSSSNSSKTNSGSKSSGTSKSSTSSSSKSSSKK